MFVMELSHAADGVERKLDEGPFRNRERSGRGFNGHGSKGGRHTEVMV
jgi:hypothetical protein